jgi:tetratricopeptide (TPR) repeat protein
MPANAVFATVLCAHLCARGQEALEDQPDPAEDSPAFGPRDRVLGLVARLAPLLATAVVVTLGFGLVERGWSKARAAHLRRLAFAQDRASEQGRSDRKVALLEAAVRHAPGDAELQSEAAYAHLGAMATKRWLLSAPRVPPGGSAPQQPGPAPGSGPDPAALERLTRAHLLPARRFLLRARDLCPVRAVAHLDLANLVADLASADPQAAYLQRVKLLAPADPWLWYQCGVTALAAGRSAEAWADWRGSLALSTAHLPEILERSRAHLDPQGILRDVLPDRHDVLLEVARALYPQPDEGRRPFLERALASLEDRGQPPSARDLRTTATIHRELGQPAQALEAYRAALLREPNHPRWRYELAELSYEQGHYEDAHQELLTILALEPKNVRARTLLDAVARGLAEHR